MFGFDPLASEATKIEVSRVANMTGICRSMTNKNRYTDGIKLYFFHRRGEITIDGAAIFWYEMMVAKSCIKMWLKRNRSTPNCRFCLVNHTLKFEGCKM